MMNLILTVIFIFLVLLNLIFAAKVVFKFKVDNKYIYLIPMPFMLMLLILLLKSVVTLEYNIDSQCLVLGNKIIDAYLFNLLYMVSSFIISAMFTWFNKQSEKLDFTWMNIVMGIALVIVFGSMQYSALFH